MDKTYMDPPRSRGHPQVLVPYSQSWHTAKIVLRSLSLVSAAVLLILCIVDWATNRSWPSAGLDWAINRSWPTSWPLLTLTLPVLSWDTAEFVTLCVRRRQQGGIHPGIHVAFELIIWLYAMPSWRCCSVPDPAKVEMERDW